MSGALAAAAGDPPETLLSAAAAGEPRFDLCS